MKVLLTLLFLLTTTTAHANDLLTALDLKWGQTPTTLRENKIALENCNSSHNITSCQVINKKKGAAYDAIYKLFFSKDEGLQKIQFTMKKIENDATGIVGKTFYTKLKKFISRKYNSPTSYEFTGKQKYTQIDQFYECLQHDGCGAWVSFWEMKNGDFTYLLLSGVGKGSGFLILFSESELWQHIAASLEK